MGGLLAFPNHPAEVNEQPELQEPESEGENGEQTPVFLNLEMSRG